MRGGEDDDDECDCNNAVKVVIENERIVEEYKMAGLDQPAKIVIFFRYSIMTERGFAELAGGILVWKERDPASAGCKIIIVVTKKQVPIKPLLAVRCWFTTRVTHASPGAP